MKTFFHPPQRKRRLASLLILPWLAFATPPAQAQTRFHSLDELLAYADQHSAVSRSAHAQDELARLQAFAAKANTLNLRGSASITATNNFALPVNFIPAEIFGGPSGTFREITLGQQYVNVASIAPQLDILNPPTWARVRSASLSEDLTATTNLLNRRTLHESIAGSYYNYRAAEAQVEIARKSLTNADSISAIVQRRYEMGIVRKQDLNNTLANRVNLADFVQQLEIRRAQQLLTLQALLGMNADESIEIDPAAEADAPAASAEASSSLLSRQSRLQAQLQHSELRAQRMAFLPTLTLTGGFNWQQNSNESIFNDAEWIDSRFIGLKLSVPIPTETRLWSLSEEYRISLKMKEINAEQVKVQESIQNEQIELDYARATQSIATTEAIQALKQENYQSALVNYHEGIIGADILLTAFTDLLNAELNADNARWNLRFQFTRIELNQQMQ